MSKRRSPADRPAPPTFGPKTPEEDAYIRSLIAHGQAARPLPDGSLPPGATHELVEDEEGQLRVIRRRFSS